MKEMEGLDGLKVKAKARSGVLRVTRSCAGLGVWIQMYPWSREKSVCNLEIGCKRMLGILSQSVVLK